MESLQTVERPSFLVLMSCFSAIVLQVKSFPLLANLPPFIGLQLFFERSKNRPDIRIYGFSTPSD
jgi:hypothetical protein